MEQLRKELVELKKEQSEFLKTFKDNLFVIKSLREDFGKDLEVNRKPRKKTLKITMN